MISKKIKYLICMCSGRSITHGSIIRIIIQIKEAPGASGKGWGL